MKKNENFLNLAIDIQKITNIVIIVCHFGDIPIYQQEEGFEGLARLFLIAD
jgi:hypothetical protein